MFYSVIGRSALLLRQNTKSCGKIEFADGLLGILRVIILIGATLALLVALGAFVSALPALMRQVGISHDTPATGGSLGDYVDERKATAPQANTDGTATPVPAAKRNIDPNLAAAARNVFDYLSKEKAGKPLIIVPKLEDAFVSSSADVPLVNKADYYKDAKRLSDQLEASKGKRLTVEQVGDLFQWHEHKFVADLTAKEAKRLADTGASLLKLYIAGYAFTAFILVVFTFLFVKIERSLRVVRVVRTEADYA